jgi:hypothetical protein
LEFRSDQGEFRIKAAITKKENDSVYFLKGDSLLHQAILKILNTISKPIKWNLFLAKVVTGLTNMVIANVPTNCVTFCLFPNE